MKISVVTPNYNGARFLEKTIKSVIEQDFPVEHILVDGGSTDGSRDIIEKYRDHFSKIIIEPDDGHADALNKGFAASTGKIMCWINSDDILLPGSLKVVSDVLQTRPAINWLYGRVTLTDEDDNQTDPRPPAIHSRIKFLCGGFRWLQQESTFWTRSLWDAAGGKLDTSFKLANDLDLWMRFFRKEKLHHVDAPLGVFRKRKGQRSEDLDSYYQEAEQIMLREREMVSESYASYFSEALRSGYKLRTRDELAALPRINGEDQPTIKKNPDTNSFEAYKRLNSSPLPKAPSFGKRPDLYSMRDRHAGKRCVIMGNGPSLNKMDLSVFSNEIVFASNSAFLLFDRIDWRPRYYACIDSRVLPDTAQQIMQMHLENPEMTLFFPERLSVYDGKGTTFLAADHIRPAPNRHFFKQINMDKEMLPWGAFSLDASEFVYTANTVTITLMQLAYHLGFSEMHLIGCDTSYVVPDTVRKDNNGLFLTSTKDDDPNHFDARYFGAGRAWHAPRVEDMLWHYYQAAVMLEETGTRVYNSGVGGNLEYFHRVDYLEFFHRKAA